ncbi:MAG: T9SS type A sorting domain-containing protein [Bacteroidota bacterium]
MKKIFLLLAGAICSIGVFAQREGILPLENNPVLQSYAKQEPVSTRLAKKAPNRPVHFPVTEHFVKSRPDTFYWADSNVTVQQKKAVFNAQDFSGVTYRGADGSKGITDLLSSKVFNFVDFADSCYVYFDYSTGATWQAGDSLVLQAYNSAGEWDNIWISVPIMAAERNISFPFSLGLLYQHASFKLRFVSYSDASASNTQTFTLSNFIFSFKQQLPFYENILWDTVYTYRNTWSKMQGSVTGGYDIKWGNLVKLDAYDENGALYNNGFNDTIQSNSFDLSVLAPRDSVFFRFYYRAVSTQNTDSLILQFKNNGGIWVNQLTVSAGAANTWNTFIRNVNGNRFNHNDFQYRVIARSNSTVSDTLKWLVSGFHVGKKIILPFLDDFSASSVYPDQEKWTNKLVFVNHNYPIAPPSIKVATFDGLNRLGEPYGTGKGYCDTLTSKPINLHGLSESDSVYLSFYVQPKGLGHAPTNSDSLILEARFNAASTDSFRLLWRVSPAGFSTTTFTQVRMLIPRIYLHDDFQLRFRNIGSRTGNLTHWHLDYVYLDDSRTSSDVILDVAIRDYPSPLFKKYSAVPYPHFKQSPASFLSDSQYVTVNNNSLQTYAVNYGREVFDQEFNRLDTFGNLFNNFAPQSTQVGSVKRTITVNNFYNTDSALLHSRFYTRIGTTFDELRANDTVWQPTYMGNYYAYDDGTAEAGYGILEGFGKVALRYAFSKPDSLYGISVSFNRSTMDVSTLPFSLKVWSSISPETELLSIPARAMYFSARNGFHYVKFENPVYVQNEVYIGWEQNQIFPLNVGLDLNYKVNDQYAPNPEMSYYVDGLWRPSAEGWGALMMRPLVGKWIDPPPVGLKENTQQKLQVSVYPNPSSGLISIKAETFKGFTVVVFDLAGKEVFSAADPKGPINLEQLNNGLYFIKVADKQNGSSAVSKILISH